MLADDIVLLDHGKIVATGTPAQLKARTAANASTSPSTTPDQLGPARAGARGGRRRAPPRSTARSSSSPPRRASRPRLIEVVRALEDGGVDANDVRRREATLDDVFFSLTSPRARARAAPPPSH